ncbi:MAG: hypothetical protein KY437_08210 [Actinobacteria bacterium]|nr:hypothetical protein [Actinomycetota bacterium]
MEAPGGEVAVFGWSALLRRLLRVLVAIGVRQVVRHGRHGGRTHRERSEGEGPTIIDVERVDTDRPFARFSEAAQRVVARAAARDGGVILSGSDLLLTLIDADEVSAGRLLAAGTRLHALREHLQREGGPSRGRAGVDRDVRRALRLAPEHADRRGASTVEPQDVLSALLDQEAVAALIRDHTSGRGSVGS